MESSMEIFDSCPFNKKNPILKKTLTLYEKAFLPVTIHKVLITLHKKLHCGQNCAGGPGKGELLCFPHGPQSWRKPGDSPAPVINPDHMKEFKYFFCFFIERKYNGMS